MKSILRCLLAALAISATSASAAQQPAAGLLVYESVANYIEVFEFVSITRKNLFDSNVIRPTGRSFACKTENIVAVVNYPPLFISPENAAVAKDSIRNIESLAQRYPKLKGQLQAVEAKWNTALEAGMQMKLKEPVAQKQSSKTELFSFTTTDGKKYENVTISGTSGTEISVVTDSGIDHIPFEQLPKDMQARFHYVPQAVIAQAQRGKDVQPQQTKAALDKVPRDLLPSGAQSFTTINGKKFENVTVLGRSKTGIYVVSDCEIEHVPFEQLSNDLQVILVYLAAHAGAQRDKPEAAKWFRKAADQGLAQAQSWLGDCYDKGNGVVKDPEEAVKWYRKAADQGLAQAQDLLGLHYAIGKGVAKDPEEAVKWYQKAADQGDVSAQSNLGFCYLGGNGVEKNPVEAVKWLRKAADRRDALAQYGLGYCYGSGRGVAKNPEEAVKWYQKAADQGFDDAQKFLGDCYHHGNGVEKNPVEAVKWYRKAADQGNAKAQYCLGHSYYCGDGVTKDPEEAVKYFLRAADQGLAEAQSWLGVCYEEGNGVAKDPEKALKWYRKAKENGCREVPYDW